MQKFCFSCKAHIDTPSNDAFSIAGHTDQPVKRLQRDLGRKQRPAEWQRA